ncbi:polymorphic toxin-type HINT domain-containing protein [Deinococcus roseus]|uniref:Intein C-terminal splicing domain-containing protein n=1 Tax=Deinococcus roseus TaxID=392414 RepID=A0ABQ2DIV2_9DEIO|nr:polymorphic toxin-type HINT domain-containing protein [Deinococcus roseus]GGJ59581.1 hypothetical protein GCM10008938_52130 [Deinococcus roseus]
MTSQFERSNYVTERSDGEARPKPEGHPDLSEKWVGAGHLKIGDKLKQADGTLGEVRYVNTIQEARIMYNLEVEEAHTFFVGTQGWLVHNGDKNSFSNHTDEGLLKSLASYQKLIDEHEEKLSEYLADPDAHDNKGLLKNATPELRAKIIEGRAKSIEKQLIKQRGEYQKVVEELARRGCKWK